MGAMNVSVVTGASGLVGAALIRELTRNRAPAHTVRALYRSDRRPLEDVRVESRPLDILEIDRLREAFQGADVVYHSAAHISIDPREAAVTRRVNVEGTRNVVQACREMGVRRLVHVSSAHALRQGPLDTPLDENRPLEDAVSASPYELSKAEAERIVLEAAESGLDAVVVNPSGVIGPYDFKPSHTGQMLFNLSTGALPALLPGGHDWVDSRDVALGAIAAAQRGRTAARYLLGGTYASLTELASMIEGATGTRPPRWVVPMKVARVGALGAELWCRMTNAKMLFNRQALLVLESKNRTVRWHKARTELGYSPRPLDETIRDIVSWKKCSAAREHKAP